VAFAAGTMVSGMITSMLHIATIQPPKGVAMESLFAALLLSSPLLVIGIAPIASGLGRGFASRWLAIFLFLYITIGVNTVLEAKIFSNMIMGSVWVMFVHYITPCLVTAAAVAWCFGSKDTVRGLPRFTAAGWAWRIAAAWLAFPVIYWTFGMCVAPFVLPYYNAGVAGLRIPPVSVILEMQLLRSPMFLVPSLALIALWTRSRRSLIVTLGIAHAILVGIYGLAQATFFPMTLRIAHSIEISFDSFAYAVVLVWLFVRHETAETVHEEKAELAAHAG
jgi:hypothetical protein